MVYETFLEKVAKYILEKTDGNTKNALVVFPNKRPAVFLKKHLTALAGKTIWLSEIMSIDDFMSKVSGTVQEDPLKIYFKLYDIHKRIAGEKSKTLDEFLNWAPLILSDFEDIDYSLADAGKTFSYLTDVRALEQWNSDGRPLTGMQHSYLSFFRSLSEYYMELKKNLARNNSGYRAMIYRNVAENTGTLFDNFKRDHFFFAGFNALTKAEQKVIDYLNSNKKGFHFIVDADLFYIDNPKQKQKEAGRFINENVAKLKLKPALPAENLLSKTAKNFKSVAVPLSVGQALYASQITQEWLIQGIDPMEIAIVLGDENLLVPLLNSLPRTTNNKTVPYNVTLGYSLSHSPHRFFTDKWLEILTLRQNEPSGKFFVPAISSLLNGALLKILNGEKGKVAGNIFVQKNIVMINENMLDDILTEAGMKETAEILFTGLIEPVQFVSRLEKISELLNTHIEKDDTAANSLFYHQTQLFRRQIAYLKSIVEKYGNEISWKTLQKTVQHIFSGAKINLHGEPLNGVQIMGVLETRSLDFKNVIFVGLNEGILPGNSFKDTLIPFDVRKKFALPLPQDSTAVYAYHFFRLLQRAGNAVFLYNSEAGNLGGGEKSRFILQIEDELLKANEKIVYEERFLESPVNEIGSDEKIEIPKYDEVIEKLDKLALSGFSPSALNTYLACPLKFYFRYILKIKEPETAEISVEANTFGKVVHDVLMNIYSPFTGKNIDITFLEKKQDDIDRLLNKSFEEHYKTSDLSYGRNALIYSVAKEYIVRFLKYDIDKLKKEPRKIVALEKRFEYHLDINGKTVKLKGFFDRVDSGDNDLRIIDYKTGKVDKQELNIKSTELLIGEKKSEKAFQVLLYALIYLHNHPATQNLRTGIISLRNISNGFMEVSNKETDINELINDFENVLKEVLEEIFNPAVHFTQTNNDKNCKYCEFKEICNR